MSKYVYWWVCRLVKYARFCLNSVLIFTARHIRRECFRKTRPIRVFGWQHLHLDTVQNSLPTPAGELANDISTFRYFSTKRVNTFSAVSRVKRLSFRELKLIKVGVLEVGFASCVFLVMDKGWAKRTVIRGISVIASERLLKQKMENPRLVTFMLTAQALRISYWKLLFVFLFIKRKNVVMQKQESLSTWNHSGNL